MDEKTRNHITNFVNSNKVMVLGVAENNIPYACTVWYTSSDGKNLYFMSRTATQHCQIIVNSPQVSVVIYDQASHYNYKKGVQLLGTAERVSDPAELNDVAARYIVAFPSSEKMINSLLPAMSGLAAPAAFYRVTLQEAKMLDTQAEIMSEAYEVV